MRLRVCMYMNSHWDRFPSRLLAVSDLPLPSLSRVLCAQPPGRDCRGERGRGLAGHVCGGHEKRPVGDRPPARVVGSRVGPHSEVEKQPCNNTTVVVGTVDAGAFCVAAVVVRRVDGCRT